MTADEPTRFRRPQLLQQWFREDGGFQYDVGQPERAGSGGAELRAFLARVRPGRLLRAVRRLDGDHGAHHRHPRPGGGRLPRGRAVDQRRVRVLRPRPARLARAVLPGSPAGCASSPPRRRAPPSRRPTPRPSSRPITESPSPSASRSTELLPIAGRSPTPTRARPTPTPASIPWVPIIASVLGLALLALLLLTPRLVRDARRRRRLAGDIEDLWVELRDARRDLGHGWPAGRSPRPAGAWLGRLLAAPAAGHDRPDRPRRGRDQAPEAAYALDRLVVALERSRYARDPSPSPPPSTPTTRTWSSRRWSPVSRRARSDARRGGRPRSCGRRTSWRPRGRAGTAQTETPDHETSRTVDELVG